MKKWYEGTVKEGDKLVCIKKVSQSDKNRYFMDDATLIEKDDQYLADNGCMTLRFINGDGCGEWPVMGMGMPMPTPAWFRRHFAILS